MKWHVTCESIKYTLVDAHHRTFRPMTTLISSAFFTALYADVLLEVEQAACTKEMMTMELE